MENNLHKYCKCCKNEIDIKNKAIENFSTEVGSLDFFLKLLHNIDINGAKAIINIGFKD